MQGEDAFNEVKQITEDDMGRGPDAEELYECEDDGMHARVRGQLPEPTQTCMCFFFTACFYVLGVALWVLVLGGNLVIYVHQ